MIALELGGWGLRAWAQPSSYSEAVKAQFFAMPGVRWNSTAGRYEGPQEALALVGATLESAGVVLQKGGWSEPQAHVFSGAALGLFRDYQLDGISWIRHMLATEGAALLADEMGIGKTAQAIAALESSTDARILVLAPAIAVPHWAGQIRRWSPLGLKPERWLVMSPEKFTRAVKKGLAPQFTHVILDEIHYYGNPKSQRSKAVAGFLAAHETRPLVIGLSGTPLQTRVRDLWHVLDLLWPGRFGRFWDFQKRYCDGHYVEIQGLEAPVWQADGASRIEELAIRLRACMLRRTKADVALELPERTRIVREIELPAKQRNEARRLLRDAPQWGSTLDTGAQIGALLDGVERYKVAAAVQLATEVSEAGGRPLILSRTQAAADEIGTILQCPVGHGGIPAANRRAALLSGGGPACSTIYAVTTGIDLIEFDTVIFVSPDWVPTNLLQAEARIHRLGQSRAVMIYFLIGLGTVDETIRERVIDRLEILATLTGEGDERGLAQDFSGTEDELMAQLTATILKGSRS